MPQRNKRIRWGFKWPQVGGGLLMLLIGGGIAIAGWLSGRFLPWPSAIAVIGLFTLLSGLIGEEGDW